MLPNVVKYVYYIRIAICTKPTITYKVGRGNLERGVTWNDTFSWASCTKMGAVRETLWGVVGGISQRTFWS